MLFLFLLTNVLIVVSKSVVSRFGSNSHVGLNQYLFAVHHVPEAGQSVDTHVHVLVLDGPHGELQGCGQVTAAGRQLDHTSSFMG